jgi:hypothetical protein
MRSGQDYNFEYSDDDAGAGDADEADGADTENMYYKAKGALKSAGMLEQPA